MDPSPTLNLLGPEYVCVCLWKGEDGLELEMRQHWGQFTCVKFKCNLYISARYKICI
jgi:hypothetical protein